MGQNRLENQIKEKLNSREIQPSAQAWDRLDAMLSVAEEKKTKRSFGWLYIAAGILVFVTLGMFFFSQNGTEVQPQNNEVVEAEVQQDSVDKTKNNSGTLPISVQNQDNQVAHSGQNVNQKNTNTNHQSSIINQKTTENQKSINPLINRDKQIEFQNSSDVAVKDLPKIMEGTAIVVKPNLASNAKTDEELLASLDKVAKKSTDNKSNLKVDARNLLSQVDGELEMTFREKVISKVAKNYKEV